METKTVKFELTPWPGNAAGARTGWARDILNELQNQPLGQAIYVSLATAQSENWSCVGADGFRVATIANGMTKVARGAGLWTENPADGQRRSWIQVRKAKDGQGLYFRISRVASKDES